MQPKPTVKTFILYSTGLIFLLIPFSTLGQVWTVNLSTDSISITGPYSDVRPIVFNSFKYPQYDPRYRKYGIHFKNNLVNEMPNQISIAQLQGSPTLGAWGPNTEVIYNGRFLSDGGQSVPHLVVQNGGKIRFGPSALIDLVLPGSFFTRQFWCMGDGTGIIEMDPGFIADRTQGGLVDTGFGSIRLNNVIFVTHETQGLPLGFRPNPSLINSHFVFERNPGSVWRVVGNDQEYKGGLWISQHATIDAQKNVNVSGVRTTWSDYVNFGGVFLEDTAVTLTKKGPASFILSGEHGYALNTRFKVEEGSVEFRTDPFNEADSAFYRTRNRLHGQNLILEMEGSSKLISRANTVRINSLNVLSVLAETQVWHGSILVAKSASLNGKFSFRLPNGLLVSSGDSFVVTRFAGRTGVFAAIQLPTYNNAITWDTSGFYSRGVLKVASGSVITNLNETIAPSNSMFIFPNPFQQELRFASGNVEEFRLYNVLGVQIFSSMVDQQTSINLPQIPVGCYFYKVKTRDGEFISGKIEKR